jgi:hypothetical protein
MFEYLMSNSNYCLHTLALNLCKKNKISPPMRKMYVFAYTDITRAGIIMC